MKKPPSTGSGSENEVGDSPSISSLGEPSSTSTEDQSPRSGAAPPDDAGGAKTGGEEPALDKLEQPRQGGGESGGADPSEASQDRRDEAAETLKKRARAKYITSGIVEKLEELDSSVPYSRAHSCCEIVEQRDGKLESRYCRSRWCINCNRIRAGVRINKYVPAFKEWARNGGVQFVTLTVPNCEGDQLSDTLDEMRHQLKLCRRQIRRTRGLEYKGVRSVEVTYNPETETYHPHFHIAVCGRSTAIAVRDEWLERWPEACRDAQDVTAWDGDPGSLKELVKYPTKLMTGEGEDHPPVEALDRIFRVLRDRPLFVPTGFNVADYHEDLDPSVDLDEFEDIESTVCAFHRPDEKVLWVWDDALNDWVDRKTGECLTGWSPSKADRDAARVRGDP